MLYAAEALLLGEGLAYSKHSGVIAAFGQRFAKTGRLPVVYHRYLIEAEQRRNISDYDTMTSVSEQDAVAQIERAVDFLAVAESSIERGSTGVNGV
jgi:uncharacterized protein (UPF0332 family)